MSSCFSDIEIEELAEGLMRQYLGKLREVPLQVDIEGFLTGFLKLPLKYRSFAEDDFGKIGYISDGVTPLRVMSERCPIREVFPKGTVVLEKFLQNRGEEGHSNAIQIVVHIKPIRRRTVIGYVPSKLARELSKVLDMGIQVTATLMQIIGGYGWKESLGALINIAV